MSILDVERHEVCKDAMLRDMKFRYVDNVNMYMFVTRRDVVFADVGMCENTLLL